MEDAINLAIFTCELLLAALMVGQAQSPHNVYPWPIVRLVAWLGGWNQLLCIVVIDSVYYVQEIDVSLQSLQ